MKTQTTELKESNSLIYKTTKTVRGECITVTISLNDECENGHQDFHITGDIYKSDKPRNDRYFISGGCIHDEIKKHFPEFYQFIRLHSSDYKGIPTHPTANGFYHLENGFNNTPVNSTNFKKEFCEHYRITNNQFAFLKKSKNETQYAVKLESLGILYQWEAEAQMAIKELERLTGTSFLVDSKRTQYVAPTAEELKEEAERQASGYYTAKAEEQRRVEADENIIANLLADRDKVISKETLETNIKINVFKAGGKMALDNMIYYTHSNTLAFNWNTSRYRKALTQDEIDTIVNKLNLPPDTKVENQRK